MPPISLWSFLMLFLCAAALIVLVAVGGGFFALYCAHLGRTGAPPKLPTVSLAWMRRNAGADDDDDEPKPAPRRNPGIGP